MKRLSLVFGVLALGLLPVSSSVLAGQSAPPQGGYAPGMPTLARVQVINGRDQAMPVILQSGGEMQPVTIVGTPSVAIDGASTMGTRAVRQGWEYRTLPMPNGSDAAAVLNSAGAEGWEAVGVTGAGSAAQVLLKRPR